jgi:hypothetical protein
MLAQIAASGATGAFHIGLILTTFGFGFRHGIDWDHIAALTDITSSQDTPRRSMQFATLYAVGHALVVFALGFAAIVLAERLPNGIDAVMERFVGVTLVILGVYVFSSLARHGRDFRMRSRWMLLFSGVRRGTRWLKARRRGEVLEIIHDHEHAVEEVHAGDHIAVREPLTTKDRRGGGVAPATRYRHKHRHVGPTPDDPFLNYGKRTAFGVGMIHGVGAETPTQVLVFITAAGAGGTGLGLLLLGCFLVGLLSSNTLIAVAGTFGFLGSARNFKLYVAVSVLTATFSLIIGLLFLLGRSTLLPSIFGG